MSVPKDENGNELIMIYKIYDARDQLLFVTHSQQSVIDFFDETFNITLLIENNFNYNSLIYGRAKIQRQYQLK